MFYLTTRIQFFQRGDCRRFGCFIAVESRLISSHILVLIFTNNINTCCISRQSFKPHNVTRTEAFTHQLSSRTELGLQVFIYRWPGLVKPLLHPHMANCYWSGGGTCICIWSWLTWVITWANGPHRP